MENAEHANKQAKTKTPNTTRKFENAENTNNSKNKQQNST